ncbi:MAG TPA: permease [candidate division Zixibacteria bacterium]|nr:permease [candidate division Zixibacteria bacterium]
MLPSILILGTLVVVLLVVAVLVGGWSLAWRGMSSGGGLLLSVLPQLLLGFLLAGLITVLLPRDLLASVVGEESGLTGLVVATVAGLATPGGPFLQFPLVAALMQGGAGAGPVAAYLTAWSLLGWNRVLIWELPLLGPSFTVSRLVVTLLLPILVGLLVPVTMRFIGRTP